MTALGRIDCHSPLVAVVHHRKLAVRSVVAHKGCLIVERKGCQRLGRIGRLAAHTDWFGHIRHRLRCCSRRIAALRIAVSLALFPQRTLLYSVD